ncbi:hypothetical protein MMC10_002744 [Thelotrema lepadinum]|nr:hypothetical protein [Thelotrema lepadinum]
MSLFFYKKPDFIDKDGAPLNYVTVHKYAEKAAACKNCIPERLSFDNVMEGKTLPPCSLVDFMDYLFYVSRDAENLQFLLWLRDYTRRFNELPESEATLSPEWAPDGKALAELKSAAHSRMVSPGLASKEKPAIGTSTREISTPTTTSNKTSLDQDRNAQAQPFRAEVNLVIQHYLTQGAPRELNLSFRIRAAILEALQRTTHPSAFAPLRDLTEQCLRNQSHPNFIRWAISNGRPPRSIILRQMTGSTFIFFLAGEIALILSHYSRWIRISLSPLLFLAIVMMHAVVHGFCMILTMTSERELRPWEMFGDDDESVVPLDPSNHSGSYSSMFSSDDLASTKLPKSASTMASDAGSQTTRSTGTLRSRMSRMNPFGPGNTFDQEAWVDKWNRMAWWRKGVITFSLGKVHQFEEGVKEIHHTFVYQSLLWATIITILVMVVFVALPEVGLF